MNSRDLARYLILGGVIAGVSAGNSLKANTISLNDSVKSPEQIAAKAKAKGKQAKDLHACKGLNSCKGKGSCKSSDNGCAGKNSCKGKGGCASKEYQHACKGQNNCKGQGAGGKNDCKGKGGCAVPPKEAAKPA